MISFNIPEHISIVDSLCKCIPYAKALIVSIRKGNYDLITSLIQNTITNFLYLKGTKENEC
jgi:hypothetical protein